MKILWSANLLPKEAAKHIGIKSEVLGGWVESMAERLKAYPDIELAIACKTEESNNFDSVVNGVRYISLGYSGKNTLAELEDICNSIIDTVQPDLIQVEGTEFLHSRAMLNAGNKKSIPVIVSLQGILNGQYQYQCGQLQIDDMMFSRSLKEVFTAWILHLRKTRWFKPRMAVERETIKSAKYLLGRTTWDRAHAYKLNPNAKYFTCNRILRAPFYQNNWNVNKMERHSIYIGNGYYALKGAQYVIEALPQLIREYPDIKVYIAGVKPFIENDKRPFYKKGYGLYLEKRIKDLGVGEHIVFTGPLQAEEVAEKLSKVNVYVLCSAIENSPNTLGEAMMVGTPCVAAYVGGVSDMATDGESVLFYRNDDPALLAWAVKRIFDDDELALKLSANAKNQAGITHNPDLNSQALYNAYKEILNF
jgi:hypothetical protein